MLSLRIGLIYCFLNLINRKRYIGGTKSGRGRFNDYRLGFAKGKCHSILLQRAFLKYGAENFRVIILEEIPHIENDTVEWFKARLLYAEQFWMDYYASWARECGYNISPTAGSPLGLKRSKKTKEKISKSLLEVGKDPKVKKKRSEAQIKRYEDPEERKKHSKSAIKRYEEDPEARRKLSKARIKYYEDHPEAKEKISEARIKYFKDPEARRKLSKSLLEVGKDPKVKKKRSKAQLKRYEDPKEREKTSKALCGRKLDKKVKKKMSKARKRWIKEHLEEFAAQRRKAARTRRSNNAL